MRSHLPYKLLTGILDDLGGFAQQMGLTGKMAAGARGTSSGGVWAGTGCPVKNSGRAERAVD